MAIYYGTNGADTLIGSALADFIYASPRGLPSTDTGADSVRGEDGNDLI